MMRDEAVTTTEARANSEAHQTRILQVLAQGPVEGMLAREVLAAMEEEYGSELNATDLELDGDGQHNWVTRARTASADLKKAGNLIKPIRGLWKLTLAGREQNAMNPALPAANFNDGEIPKLAPGSSHTDRARAADDTFDTIFEGGSDSLPERQLSVVNLIKRARSVADKVKELYSDQCQACETRLITAGGPVSQGAHIRPLGAPHHGVDNLGNVLCLCPNCHVLFDGLVMWVDPEGMVYLHGKPTKRLTVRADHRINSIHFDYHLERCERATP